MNPAKLKLTPKPKLYVLVSSGEPKLHGYGPPSYKLLIEATCSQSYVHIFFKLIHVKLLQKVSGVTSHR